VEVIHFHGLCESMAKAAGLDFAIPSDSDAVSEFYNRHSPALLEQAIAIGAGPRFDAVIVDEGQDFVADWWLSIEDLLTDPRQGTMYVFYDPEQNIFGRNFGFLVDEAKLTLDKNCRNTTQIASYVNRVAGRPSKSADFAPEGLVPVERSVNSSDSEVEEADRIVADLIHNKGLTPNRILLLGRHRRSNSPFAHIGELAGVPLVDEAMGSANDRSIQYATIFRFKGLEADCVILTGFRRPKAGDVDPTLYCAASRAKLLLYALYRTESAATP
jgi:superfamily I DNA/RNA helicase